MDSYNLKTASSYLNNLLLARGLLRNGTPIEFAHPSKGEGGKEATMAAIINLVHDIILRRDKEQDHQATLAQTLRTLRSEATRTTTTLERLQIRNEDLVRQLSLAQSQERAARTALRTAESSARALREEMGRLKTTVAQIRASCANDVRKRDVQIQKLKTHLTAQQRGNRSGLVGASITITPGSSSSSGTVNSTNHDASPDIDDPEYTLKQETTEFLTQLSQSLSDENDNLIGLIRSTLLTLKELQGLPENLQRAALSGLPETQDMIIDDGGMVQAMSTSYETLAVDMDLVLENLRTLLTNPSFVPVEEVELREEEILRLREGWEKMEVRWKEAIGMMDVWRKRLLNGGDTVNLDELKQGLDLGASIRGFNAPPSGRDDAKADVEFSVEIDSSDLDELESVSDVDIPDKDSGIDLFELKLPQASQVLKESSGNNKSPRKVTFNPTQKEPVSKSGTESTSLKESAVPAARTSKLPRAANITNGSTSQKSSQTRRKRPSSPHPDQPSPKLTVQDKLKIAQDEAEAAGPGVAAKQRVAEDTESDEALGKLPSPRKTNIRGRPRRRKSTLSPEELELLLQTG